MCIVVFYLGEKYKNIYEVILASNRDESFSRPTSSPNYYFDPDKSFRKCMDIHYNSNNSEACGDQVIGDKTEKTTHNTTTENTKTTLLEKPNILLGSRDNMIGNNGLPLLGSQLLVGSGKRWAVLTNALGPWDDPKFYPHSQHSENYLFFESFAVNSNNNNNNNNHHTVAGMKQLNGHDNLTLNRRKLLGIVVIITTIIMILFLQNIITKYQSSFLVIIPLLLCFFFGCTVLQSNKANKSNTMATLSRGQLVVSFVNSNCSPEQFIDYLEKRKDIKFEGYNLVIGIGNEAYFVSNRPQRDGPIDKENHFIHSQKLQQGKIYCFSNGIFNCNKGKVQHLRSLFKSVVDSLETNHHVYNHKSTKNDNEIQMNDLDSIANYTLHAIMKNTDECECIPTHYIQDIDERKSKIFVEPFQHIHENEASYFGTRESTFFTMEFDERSSCHHNLFGLDGLKLWNIDRRDDNVEMRKFSIETHREAIEKYRLNGVGNSHV